MVIAPNTNIILLKCPLEEGDPHTLDFDSRADQTSYFQSLPQLEIENATYQRKDNVIRYPGKFDDLINYNYVMYQNESYSDKWFYAFISRIEYMNDNMTNIYIKTDVWQTWQFDLHYFPTFIEREHTNNDTAGNNTLPENLDLGEPVVSREDAGFFMLASGSNPLYSYVQVAFQVTELIGDMKRPVTTGSGEQTNVYNGLFSGLYFFSAPSPAEADKIISAYANAGKADAIVAIFLIPNALSSGLSQTVTSGSDSFTINWVLSNDAAVELKSANVIKPTYVGEAESGNVYVPRNKKLFTYPYCYLYATNFCGQETTYRFEDWKNNVTPSFKMYGSISQGCSIRLLPQNYKMSTTQTDTASYGLTGGKLPILAWATDYYTNWLTQNAVNIQLSHATNAINTVGNLLGGNVGGALSGVTGILSTMAQQEQMKIIPDTANGQTNTGDINVGLRFVGFTLTTMSIRREYAERIDRYFDMYGYKTNAIKLPNVSGRLNWNYVKTIDCYMEADIPQDDLAEIKGMFNRGITIWHNPQNFMDYTKNNAII